MSNSTPEEHRTYITHIIFTLIQKHKYIYIYNIWALWKIASRNGCDEIRICLFELEIHCIIAVSYPVFLRLCRTCICAALVCKGFKLVLPVLSRIHIKQALKNNWWISRHWKEKHVFHFWLIYITSSESSGLVIKKRNVHWW